MNEETVPLLQYLENGNNNHHWWHKIRKNNLAMCTVKPIIN